MRNKIETDPVTIGNNFNNFFTTIVKKLTENIKSIIPFEKFLDNKQIDSRFLMPTYKNKLLSLLETLV